MSDITTPPTEVEIAELLAVVLVSDELGTSHHLTIRRLAFQRDRLPRLEAAMRSIADQWSPGKHEYLRRPQMIARARTVLGMETVSADEAGHIEHLRDG